KIVATYQVDDGHGESVQQTATISIVGVNDVPEIDLVANEVQRVTVGRQASLPDFVLSDADGDELELTLKPVNGRLDGLIDMDDATDGIQLKGYAAQINEALAAATFTA